MSTLRAIYCLTVLLVGTSYAQFLVAQGEGGLEEIIVTAEKRENNLQNTPIAVSAFTQADLERGLINNNMDKNVKGSVV